jgi:hypothetical protein
MFNVLSLKCEGAGFVGGMCYRIMGKSYMIHTSGNIA